MAVVEWRKDGAVAVLVMNTAENRHNPSFANGMLQALDEIEADQEIKSIVLSSSDKKNWSLGIDLNWMTEALGRNDTQAIKDFMYALNKLFKRILTIPIPVIAAVNGHAFGDGAILVCTCDFRFMRGDRGFFCFPEVDINIPFLPGMLAMMKKAMPYYKLEELVYSGKRAGGKELEECRMMMKACDGEEELMKEAVAYARTFAKGRKIFYEHKWRLNRHIVEIMDKEDPAYIEPLNLMIF
jgi:enoyl-CoA hydratase/carnithine racemase